MLAASQSATADSGACVSGGWSLNIGIARLSRQVSAAPQCNMPRSGIHM